MSQRKKWRLKLIPSFRYESCQSMKQAYERVVYYREQYAEGMSRVHHVNVEVHEGDRWHLYEQIIFPARDEAAT